MANLVQAFKKIAVSVVVVGTFTIYAIHDRLVSADESLAQDPQSPADASQAKLQPQLVAQIASPSPFSAVGFPTSTPISSADLAPATVMDAATSADGATAADLPTATDVPPTPTDLPTATNVPPTAVPKSGYKDGTYTGPVTNAYYGNVQVQVIIQGGKITQVKFLNYPHDRRTSQQINNYAIPRLEQEVIQAQNLNVNIVSGATLTSEAFGQSMQSALNQAQN